MNKFVNILQLLIIFPTMALTIFVGFDLPIEFLKTTGANLPFRDVIFMSFAGILLLIGARRAVRRWMGIRMVNQITRFQWNQPMNPGRIKQVNLYLYLEALLHLFVAIAMYRVSAESFFPALVLALLGIEHLMFAWIGNAGQKFRIGITSKAIVVADRDVKVLYFSGLRKVSLHQQSIFFDYIEELQLSFSLDCIAANHRAEFREVIEKNVNRDRVYFSEGFKELK
jgi:hypothetical protein